MAQQLSAQLRHPLTPHARCAGGYDAVEGAFPAEAPEVPEAKVVEVEAPRVEAARGLFLFLLICFFLGFCGFQKGKNVKGMKILRWLFSWRC